jgi:hypothetical protein
MMFMVFVVSGGAPARAPPPDQQRTVRGIVDNSAASHGTPALASGPLDNRIVVARWLVTFNEGVETNLGCKRFP